MTIPARHCTGYLGDISLPVDANPMDFTAFEPAVLARFEMVTEEFSHAA